MGCVIKVLVRLIIERKTDWSVRYEEAASQKSIASETGGSV